MIKKVILLALSVVLLFCLVSCKTCEEKPLTGTESTEKILESVPTEGADLSSGQLAVLFTSGIHGHYQRDRNQGILGFAALGSYKKQLEREHIDVILLDGGDALDHKTPAFQAAGIADLMERMGYFLAVPGESEFSLGMDIFTDPVAKGKNLRYLCSPPMEDKTCAHGNEAYQIVDYNGLNVAYLGIVSPPRAVESKSGDDWDSKADPQEFYDMVQNKIDEVRGKGADLVIGISHIGINPSESPWTSVELIKQVTGLNILLEGHSTSLVAGKTISDKDNHPVLLCSAGSDFVGFLDIRLDLQGNINSIIGVTDVGDDDPEIQTAVDVLKNQELTFYSQVVAHSEVLMEAFQTDGSWPSRAKETAMGNLVADAYRKVLGTDIAMIDGGSLCGRIPEGDVTLQDIESLFFARTESCTTQVTGQEIMDALEMAYRTATEEPAAGFLQLSGISCKVNSDVESGVILDAGGNYVGLSGKRRVSDVMVNGEPIQLERTYTLATNVYLAEFGGDGFTMLSGNREILYGELSPAEILLGYIQNDLEGIIPAELYGVGAASKRIEIIE